MFVGADGCRAGWFAVLIDSDGSWSTHVFKKAHDLWTDCQHASLILIDIPIGLRDSGAEERLCDKEARRFLLPRRGSSVFPAPCRAALGARTYGDACAINRKRTDRGLSKQSWAIAPKIREVDELLGGRPLQGRIREIHPEVCFAALNRGRPMEYRKKSKEGFSERIAVLTEVYPQALEVVDCALSRWRRKEVARDDVVDALVAAVTARLGHDDLRTFPATPETDARGRPMEIVYYPRLSEAREFT